MRRFQPASIGCIGHRRTSCAVMSSPPSCMLTQVLHLPPGFDHSTAASLPSARPHLLPGYMSAWAAQQHMQRRSLGPHMPERLHDRLSRPTLHALLST